MCMMSVVQSKSLRLLPFPFSSQVGKVTLHTKCASSKGGLHRYHPLVFKQPHLCVLDVTLHMVRTCRAVLSLLHTVARGGLNVWDVKNVLRVYHMYEEADGAA